MELNAIEKDILIWHKDTFPNAIFDAKLRKWKEEAEELIEAIDSGNIQQALEEAADVFIVGVSIASDRSHFERGVSMTRAISEKFEVVRGREWGDETEDGDRPRVK